MFKEQFIQPQGMLGKLAGKFMEKENDRLNEWTLSFLDIERNDHVLEIGFGAGAALEKAAAKNTKTLYGIDPSEAMVDLVLKKLHAQDGPEQVGIFHGEASDLCHFHAPLDKVYAVNNVTFWDSPVGTLTHLKSVMKHEGRIALTVVPHEKEASSDTTEVLGEQLQTMLIEAGFQNVRIHFQPADPNPAVCVVGMVR